MKKNDFKEIIRPRPQVEKWTKKIIVLIAGVVAVLLVGMIFSLGHQQTVQSESSSSRFSTQSVEGSLWFESKAENMEVLEKSKRLKKQPMVQGKRPLKMTRSGYLNQEILNQEVQKDYEDLLPSSEGILAPQAVSSKKEEKQSRYQKQQEKLKEEFLLEERSLHHQAIRSRSHIEVEDKKETINQLKEPLLQQGKKRSGHFNKIRAGTVIPGILISGIHSESPGYILGQVREDVYDSATGQTVVLPKGSKILGKYDEDINWAQKRLVIEWLEIILPNGKQVKLEEAYGSDTQGYNGFKDQYNNHTFSTYGQAALLSLIGFGYKIAESPSEPRGAGNLFKQSASEQFSTVATEDIRRRMKRKAEIKIRSGYRFLIYVTRDIEI